MAGFTQARQQAILDAELAAGDYIAYSTNGTSEAGIMARTAVGSWSSATAATPSVKGNAGALTSAAASGAGTITHFAIYSASTGGTQKIDWTAFATSRTVASGDQLTHAAGAITVSLD